MPLFSRTRRSLGFGVFLLGAPLMSLTAHALPTTSPLPGISGLNEIPTAETVPPATAEASLGYENIALDETSDYVDLLPVAGVIVGFRKAEIGAVYVREDSDIQGFSVRSNYYALQGKIRVYERENFGVAVGAHYYDFGSEDGFDLGSVLSGYATASYELARDGEVGSAPRARFHGGFLLQKVRGGGQSDTLLRPFVGAEAFVSQSVALGASYLVKDKSAPRAATLSLRFTPQKSALSAQIGASKLRRDTRYFVGVSYRFGRGAVSNSTSISTPAQPLTNSLEVAP